MDMGMSPHIKMPMGFRLLLAVLSGVLLLDIGSSHLSAQIEKIDREPTMPEPIKRAEPRYPYDLRRAGMMGGAVVEFIVTAQGTVEEPYSVAETDPAFGEAATKAVAKWKFKPGTKHGKPINSRMFVPIYFTLKNSGNEDWNAKIQAVLTGFQRKSSPEVPSEFQYDKAPEPRRIQAPVWPWVDGVPVRNGKADIFFAINAKGHVEQASVVSATSEVFGKAAQAAVESWRFDPAELEGKPVPALGRRDVQFQLYLPKNASVLRLLRDIKEGTTHYATASELDAALYPYMRYAPEYPKSLFEEKPAGTAVIECIVDGRGRVCLPRIVEASQEEFGWAAATAVAGWLFTPPTVKGLPVDVIVRIPFEFQGREQ